MFVPPNMTYKREFSAKDKNLGVQQKIEVIQNHGTEWYHQGSRPRNKLTFRRQRDQSEGWTSNWLWQGEMREMETEIYTHTHPEREREK